MKLRFSLSKMLGTPPLMYFLIMVATCNSLAFDVEEDFEAIFSFPSDNWSYHTCYSPSLTPEIDLINGNPDHCYVPGGAGHGENTEIYHSSYLADYSNGLVMSCDFYISDSSSHYTDLAIGLPREEIINGVNIEYLVYMGCNSSAGSRDVHCVLNSDNPNHQDLFTLPGGFNNATWFNVAIQIRSDQYVEFYLNSELIYTSQVTIDPNKNLVPPILHGFDANPVYADNFKISIIPSLEDNYQLAWFEDFESYAVGTYPSSGGWNTKWSGLSAEVTNTVISEGFQSFKQTDGPSNVRGDIHDLENSAKFKLSFDYRRDVPDTGSSVHLWQNSSDHQNIFTISHTTRDILLFGQDTGMDYTLNQWMNVAIHSNYDSLQCLLFINGLFVDGRTIPEDFVFDQIEFSTGNNPGNRSCYWDNIQFYHDLPTPTPTPTATSTPDPSDQISIEIELPQNHFNSGDTFYMNLNLSPRTEPPINGYAVVVCDIEGSLQLFSHLTSHEFRAVDLKNHREEHTVKMSVLDDTTEVIVERFSMGYYPHTLECRTTAWFIDDLQQTIISDIVAFDWSYGGR